MWFARLPNTRGRYRFESGGISSFFFQTDIKENAMGSLEEMFDGFSKEQQLVLLYMFMVAFAGGEENINYKNLLEGDCKI